MCRFVPPIFCYIRAHPQRAPYCFTQCHLRSHLCVYIGHRFAFACLFPYFQSTPTGTPYCPISFSPWKDMCMCMGVAEIRAVIYYHPCCGVFHGGHIFWTWMINAMYNISYRHDEWIDFFLFLLYRTNVVMNYSEVESKVREATNDDPWGPSGQMMSEISK